MAEELLVDGSYLEAGDQAIRVLFPDSVDAALLKVESPSGRTPPIWLLINPIIESGFLVGLDVSLPSLGGLKISTPANFAESVTLDDLLILNVPDIAPTPVAGKAVIYWDGAKVKISEDGGSFVNLV